MHVLWGSLAWRSTPRRISLQQTAQIVFLVGPQRALGRSDLDHPPVVLLLADLAPARQDAGRNPEVERGPVVMQRRGQAGGHQVGHGLLLGGVVVLAGQHQPQPGDAHGSAQPGRCVVAPGRVAHDERSDQVAAVASSPALLGCRLPAELGQVRQCGVQPGRDRLGVLLSAVFV